MIPRQKASPKQAVNAGEFWEQRRGQRLVRVHRVVKDDVVIRTVVVDGARLVDKKGSRFSTTTLARFLRDFQEIPPW